MKFSDLLKIIWNNMWKRRTRTIFTMTGVIIGCLAVFIISSITNGFEKYLTTEMERLMDTSVITIYPNWNAQEDTSKKNKKEEDSSKTVLNEKNIKELEKIDFITEIIPMRYAYAPITVNKTESYGRFLAKDNFEPKDGNLLYGRYPRKKSREIILGYELAKELLGYTWETKLEDDSVLEELVGKKIRVGGEQIGEDEKSNMITTKKFSCKIVGISSKTSGFDQNVIETSIKFVDDIIKSNPNNEGDTLNKMLNNYESIQVRVDDKSKIGEYEAYIKELGYETSSYKEFENQTNSMIKTISLVLGSLAGISLLVAALGITNTMDMAIYERNKEIGIIKVIGGSLNDVRKIFVGEACAIAVTGGIISIVLGIIIDIIINNVAGTITKSMFGVPITTIAIPSITLVIGILVFCLCIGFVSGIIPANKAAKTDVITAIR
ncbi:FtsX-like permease family protein [Clostridium sp. UBA1056]|uniref:ABC transporter permease n=1 Tax=unclassified Clostridium TaxID=2614128 RepID=UPI00321694EB